MSRISCDVTKDLLSGYLDEICSEESKELVEEHLRECPSCKQFLRQFHEQDIGKDAPKVDFLRKTRRSMDLQTILGFIISVLVPMGIFSLNNYGMVPFIFYYVEMPILMLTYAFALLDTKRVTRPKKAEWIIPIIAIAIVFAIMGLQIMSVRWIVNGSSLHVPDAEMGPYLYRRILVIAIIAIVLLALLLLIAKRKRQVFLISQNLVWLGLNLTLSFSSILRNLDTPEVVPELLIRNTIILALEFVVVTILLLVFYRKELNKKYSYKIQL